MIIPWDAIRQEIEEALLVVQYELEGGHDSASLKHRAIDHLKTAVLLMTGSVQTDIHGHRPKEER